jgi:SAM-dependent methyltransferase
MELSTDRILERVVAIAVAFAPSREVVEHLDIGSGTGALIGKLRASRPGIRSSACDYTAELMQLPGQKVDVVNLNEQPLPYPAHAFDVITCTEVVEHLENYRRLIRDMFRILRPGGLVIITTPNVLNINSRLRFLYFGFANLFGPLPAARAESFSTVGHITPISYFYLAQALGEARFVDVGLDIDKVQRSGFLKLLFLLPAIALFGALAMRREHHRYGTIDATNSSFVKSINSRKILLGRTIVVSARKPGGG